MVASSLVLLPYNVSDVFPSVFFDLLAAEFVFCLVVPESALDLCLKSHTTIKSEGNHSVRIKPTKLKYRFGFGRKETTIIKTL